jgi:hypothetical protein
MLTRPENTRYRRGLAYQLTSPQRWWVSGVGRRRPATSVPIPTARWPSDVCTPRRTTLARLYADIPLPVKGSGSPSGRSATARCVGMGAAWTAQSKSGST